MNTQSITLIRPRREEALNTMTHLIAAVIFAIGGALLIHQTSQSGEVLRVVAASVFTVGLLLLYSASSGYHAVAPGRRKERLKLLDHAAIYILIAATYTPFTLVSLSGPWGWSLFGVIWAAALLGVAAKVVLIDRIDILSTVIYIAMGWVVVVAIEPLRQALSSDVIVALVLGGLLYTGGTLFYHLKRVPYMHAVWHLFVMAGSGAHFYAVWAALVPA